MIESNQDTICAISTPLGVGGVGIVRLSGNQSLSFLKKCFTFKSTVTPRYVYQGQFYSHANKRFIDSVCVVYFQGPASYTGEDVVEIHCHSSVYILKSVMQEFISLGARIAKEGEFTKRAFIHGKLDLTQAESVIDLIHSETEASHRVSLAHVNGVLMDFIQSIRSPIKEILEQVEGSMDFPDEVDAIDRKKTYHIVAGIFDRLKDVLSYQDVGELVMGGVNVLIVGRPNVGKSSLFNMLLGKDRAIVSDIPGTTRDYLEATFEFKGYRFNLFDSAGFRHSDDQIEQLGIERISSLLDRAHVICWCVDQSDQFNADDNSVYEAIKSHHNVLVFKTKSDLDSKLILNKHITFPSYPISVYNKDLTTQIKSIFYEHTVHVSESVNLDLLCNIRQKACLDQLEQWFLNFLTDLNSVKDDDLLAIDLKRGLEICSEFSGDSLTEEVLDGIFSRFCVGK